MRTIAIGDIHGGYKALLQLLDRINIKGDDHLIFLGDYVDGWSQSVEVIDFLINFKKERKENGHLEPVYLMGNHDELLLNYFKTNQKNNSWLQHGGQITVDKYKAKESAIINKHIEFLEKHLLPYFEKDNNGFFHAGFHNLKGPKFEYYSNITYWDRSLWELALCLNPELSIENERYPDRLKLYHEIYIGHTPTTRLDSFSPINAANVWNIDTGAAYKGPLTAICIEDKTVWQSDPVHTFYPNEKGRN
ncbi:metallophosphoesterase [Nonlabens tegetincola]|uniref:metallophosphoesterase n=1 Tax=Nonlabens tegetincola TaxID=323273 RepID=UPI0030C8677B